MSAGRVRGGNIYTGQSGSAGYISGDRGTVARVADDIHADKDGNVYRHNEDGCQQHGGPGSGW